MTRHKFAIVGGRALVVLPCKINPGSVRLEIQSASREVMGAVTLDGPTLGLVIDAMQSESRAAKQVEKDFQKALGKFGSVDPTTQQEKDAYAATLDNIRTREIFGNDLPLDISEAGASSEGL